MIFASMQVLGTLFGCPQNRRPGFAGSPPDRRAGGDRGGRGRPSTCYIIGHVTGAPTRGLIGLDPPVTIPVPCPAQEFSYGPSAQDVSWGLSAAF